MARTKAFAQFGTEKMIYDIRMGPQCVQHKGNLYVVYLANEAGVPGHPHIIKYEQSIKKWSEAVRIGVSPMFEQYGHSFPDHHFAPIIWFDHHDYLHVLYRCHIYDGGIHLISTRPESIEEWREGPEIAHSISYPRLIHLKNGRLLLYYRVYGHMGYWTYQLSEDGGYTWSRHRPIIDFDRDPASDMDTWAGSYHSVCAEPDGNKLHIAFVYWDEMKAYNPLYKRKLHSINRYHLYYAVLDIASGELFDRSGKILATPVNKAAAEACKIWDSGHKLTNMPAIHVDAGGHPCFLLPVAGDSPWDCCFYFFKQENQEWHRYEVAGTNSTWSGCRLFENDQDGFTAYLICGKTDGALLPYGGGELEEWVSHDKGENWLFSRSIVPEEGLLYNNPTPVETSAGETLNNQLVFFGWEGPGGLQSTDRQPFKAENRGKAFLWHDGRWL